MILSAVLLFLQSPEADDLRRLFAAGPTEAYYMEPPEAVSKPFVRRLIWAADGSGLLVVRVVPPSGTPPLVLADALQEDSLDGLMKLHPRIQLVAWGSRSRIARTLLDLHSDRASIDNVEAMSKSDQALVMTTERPLRPDGTLGPVVHSYSLLSTSSGNVRRVWSGSEPVRYVLSANHALGAVFLASAPEPQKVALFGTDGKLGTPISLPPRAHFEFSETGNPGAWVVKVGPNGKRIAEFRLIDSRTGTLGAVVPDQQSGEKVVPPVHSFVYRDKGRDEILLLVEKGRTKEPTIEEAGVVTTDGTLPLLSPTNNAVAYVSGHGAFVRPLVKLSRKEYDDAMREAEKQKAMRYAKQMGAAMSMYAADCDDAFPPAGGDGKEVVYPYVKNRSALDAFTYTFGGGTTSGNPSGVELGFVTGPGGRAVVYADGTIKWLPDGV